LSGIDSLRLQALHRTHRNPLILGHANHDIAAIEILQIVGKGCNGGKHLGACGICIPGRLQLQTRAFDSMTSEDLFNGEDGFHTLNNKTKIKVR
jgi:hypothetical protein